MPAALTSICELSDMTLGCQPRQRCKFSHIAFASRTCFCAGLSIAITLPRAACFKAELFKHHASLLVSLLRTPHGLH